MKKRNLLLALAGTALLLSGCTVGGKQYFGFGSVATYGDAAAYTGYHVETTVDYVAVVLQKDVIKNLRLDTVQLYSKLTEGAVVLKTEENGDVKSKWELLDDYAMKVASPIGKEWYEQAEAFENWAVGKTVEQVKAGMTGTKLTDGATIGNTINVNGWVAALESAVAAKVEFKGKVAALGVGGLNTVSLKRNTTDVEGQDYTIGGAVFDEAKKVLAARVDTFQPRYVANEAGDRLVMDGSKVQVDATAKRVKSKQELKDDYGMKVASPIGKEWYEQAASLVDYIKGKTVSEALGTDAKLANGAEVGCTMNIGGYRSALLEAEHTAFNSRK
ncbi:MAG: Chlorophenol reductase precursor [Tenericutes bacterium ADurb.Bin087]|nr:MAG: Chlorophenol reductase precursor [Tenericutes bacterium ADurb.Bin087]